MHVKAFFCARAVTAVDADTALALKQLGGGLCVQQPPVSGLVSPAAQEFHHKVSDSACLVQHVKVIKEVYQFIRLRRKAQAVHVVLTHAVVMQHS